MTGVWWGGGWLEQMKKKGKEKEGRTGQRWKMRKRQEKGLGWWRKLKEKREQGKLEKAKKGKGRERGRRGAGRKMTSKRWKVSKQGKQDSRDKRRIKKGLRSREG